MQFEQFVSSLLNQALVAGQEGLCQVLYEEQEERGQPGAGSRGVSSVLSPAWHWKCSWLVFPSVEKLFIKINNGMLVWERALNQLFPRSYRCLSFQATYSAKHTAHVAEIATEQPFPLITRLPKHHLFP